MFLLFNSVICICLDVISMLALLVYITYSLQQCAENTILWQGKVRFTFHGNGQYTAPLPTEPQWALGTANKYHVKHKILSTLLLMPNPKAACYVYGLITYRQKSWLQCRLKNSRLQDEIKSLLSNFILNDTIPINNSI